MNTRSRTLSRGLASIALLVTPLALPIQAEANEIAGVIVPDHLANIIALEPDAADQSGIGFFQDLDHDDRPLAIGEGALSGPLLVNFWATWCAPCKEEMPHLDAAAIALSDDGVTVLSVSLDRNQAQAEQYLSENGFDDFLLAFDRRMGSFRKMGGRGVPYTALLDDQGRLVASLSGITDWSSPDALELIRLFLPDN